MPDKTLVKRTVRVYQEDLDIINERYPDFGYNRIVRHMLTKLADRIKEQRQDAIDTALRDIGVEDD